MPGTKIERARGNEAQAERAKGLIVPFDLTIDPVDRMVNFEIADDPHYAGLEVQAFDDPLHGRGMLVFLQRRADGRVDVYHQPGLRLDREGYGIGAGLGRWEETEIEPHRLEVTPSGVVADVRLCDSAGRSIEIHLDDRGRSPRRPASFLAPFGAGIEHPTGLLLVWMRRFDLLRDGSPLEIRIGGRPTAIGRLPGARIHRRRLVKTAASLAAVTLNRAREEPTAVRLPSPGEVEVDPEGTGIVALRKEVAGHHARLDLLPAVPDLASLAPGAPAEGRWALAIDGAPQVVGGTWIAARRGDLVDMTMNVTRGWHPRGLPTLMRVVTRVAPVFRTWPTTYRWRGSISLGKEPTVASRWERTAGERGDSYRRLTGSA